MKLKNIMKDTRKLKDSGKVIEVPAGKTIEVSRPCYNPNAFEKIKDKKEKQTLDVVKKDQLNKENTK